MRIGRHLLATSTLHKPPFRQFTLPFLTSHDAATTMMLHHRRQASPASRPPLGAARSARGQTPIKRESLLHLWQVGKATLARGARSAPSVELLSNAPPPSCQRPHAGARTQASLTPKPRQPDARSSLEPPALRCAATLDTPLRCLR